MEAFFNNLSHDNKKEGVSCYFDTPRYEKQVLQPAYAGNLYSATPVMV